MNVALLKKVVTKWLRNYLVKIMGALIITKYFSCFRYGTKFAQTPDPVISTFPPDLHFGAVSENIDDMLKNYFEEM